MFSHYLSQNIVLSGYTCAKVCLLYLALPSGDYLIVISTLFLPEYPKGFKLHGFNLPFADGACGAVEVHTYLIYGSAVGFVGDGVLFAFYLRQCLLGRAIVFELEHVNGIGELQYHVRTSHGTFYLRVHILPHEAEQQVEDGLVVLLCLVLQVIRDGGEERTGALQATLYVSFHLVAEEGVYVERVRVVRDLYTNCHGWWRIYPAGPIW